MEFWGVEVKSGQSLKVPPEAGKLIHISQAAMGEAKDAKGAKNVHLRLKVDDKNFIIGSLAAEDRTQLMFDLVFERGFELSHDWKNGSVYFIGYKADDPVSDGEDFSESEDELLETHENGEIKAKPVPAIKVAPKKEEQPSLGKDDDDDESESDSDDSIDLSGDDSDDDDDISSEEEEELSKKSKKRSLNSAQETSVPAKKAKAATPDKTGSTPIGTKKGHVATPFPSKTGKTPAGGKKPKDQTPKSGGSASCKSCSKTFHSEKAMESHTKAKHGSK